MPRPFFGRFMVVDGVEAVPPWNGLVRFVNTLLGGV